MSSNKRPARPAGGLSLLVSARTVDLVAMAHDTFKTKADAEGWLHKDHPLLDGLSPLRAAQTPAGAKRVSEILTALKWGGVV